MTLGYDPVVPATDESSGTGGSDMSDAAGQERHRSGKTIVLESDGQVAILRFDRPPANAIDLDLVHQMGTTLDEVETSRPSALVLTGTGSFFSGGLDLKAVPSYSPERQRDLLLAVNRTIWRLYGLPMPVVAAVNGHSVAGAFILTLTADYRVGPIGRAQFGLTEARVGIPFPAAAMTVLRAELAPADVRYFTLWSRNVDADEARRRGVFDELVGPEAVLPRALEVARDMATIPCDAYRRIKHQVRAGALARLEEIVASRSDPMLDAWVSPDAASASAAVLRGE